MLKVEKKKKPVCLSIFIQHTHTHTKAKKERKKKKKKKDELKKRGKFCCYEVKCAAVLLTTIKEKEQTNKQEQ